MAANPAVPLTHPAVPQPVPARRPQAGLWSNAFGRLRKDGVSLLAVGILLLFVLLAIGADFLAANFFKTTFTRQDLLNAYQPPTWGDPALWLGSDDLGRS